MNTTLIKALGASILPVALCLSSSAAFAQLGTTSQTGQRGNDTGAEVINCGQPITFSEFPVGTTITNQYANRGVIFSGSGAPDPFISQDGANPTTPVLSGSPLFQGPIEGRFVDPVSGTPRTVACLQLDAGFFDETGGTRLSWYGSTGKLLGQRFNTKAGIQKFIVTSEPGIARFVIEITGTEPAGYAIDNVGFRLKKK